MRLQKGLATCLMMAATGVGCSGEPEGGPPPTPPGQPASETAKTPEAKPARIAEPTKLGETVTTASGLKYQTLKEGSGRQARLGDTVSVHYTGKLEDGKTFATSQDGGAPMTFEVGDALLTQGWNQGVAGMKVGEQRRLIVSPQIGYGAQGRLPLIPPNATLTYEIELLEVHDATDRGPAQEAASDKDAAPPGPRPEPIPGQAPLGAAKE